MSKKSIVFITREIVPFFYGGIGSQFMAMANLLVSEGHEVKFITRRYASFEEAVFQENYPGCVCEFVDETCVENVTEFSYSGGLVSHFNLRYAQAVERLLHDISKQQPPDFIVSADFCAESFVSLLGKSEGRYRKSRFVLFIEGSTFDALNTYESGMDKTCASELDDPQNILTCAMENACIYMADHVVVPTRVTWEQTSERLSCEIHHDIIPNLLGGGFLSRTRSKSNAQEAKTLLFIGRLDHHKGADLLLQSFIERYQSSDLEDIPVLRFIGRDTFCKKYGMTFLNYWQGKIPDNLKGRIEFMGQVLPKTVRECMSVATLCVFPSRWEVYGIVCLEAMASGCPVAVSSHTGLAEVVGDRFSEFTFDFAGDRSGVFDLYERLLAMGQAEYDALCSDFHHRAGDIVARGNASLLEYFASPAEKNNTRQGDVLDGLFREIGKCFMAVGDISSVLSHDIKRVTASAGLGDDTLKSILTSGKYDRKSPAFPVQLFRSIKDGITNLTRK